MEKNPDPSEKIEKSSDEPSSPDLNRVLPPESSRALPLELNRDWCKACKICIAFCPRKVLEEGEEGKPRIAHPEACTRCGTCEVMCPDFAITVNREGKGPAMEEF